MNLSRWLWFLAVVGCVDTSSGDPASTDPGFDFPDADDHPAWRGSGGPVRTFSEDELFQPCAWLPGGEEDIDHHNLVVGYRGHLVLPWAPEWSRGGLSLFDMADPCQPEKVVDSYDQRMRETHAMGFVHLREGPHAGDWTFVTEILGILAWNLDDPTAPAAGTALQMEGVFYPDAYARVVFSVFLQYPWLYVAAADNGLIIVDVTDPTAPVEVNRYVFEPGLRAGMVQVLGNRMLVVSAEQTEAAMLDVSIPDQPQLYPGGRFTVMDGTGSEPLEVYAGGLVGDMAMFARKTGGGGAVIYDVSDPTAPSYWSDFSVPDGNGGYVFWHEGVAFIGDSSRGDVVDFTDMANPQMLGSAVIPGDLDTVTPFGNVAIFSVDDEAGNPGESSAVVPWATDPDTAPPKVLAVSPRDGAAGVATTARIGVGFNEFIDASTVFAGSIRLRDSQGRGVDAWGSAQETLANLTPKQPLRPNETYTVEVLPGGVRDLSGNALAEAFSFSFSTGAR